ncbi:protein L-Myc [Lissotriton helveticus]
MELDALQHYFYFYDTDLEEDSSRAVAPSEDIWKKFELVPSPRHLSARSTGDAAGMAPLGPDLGWDLSPPMKGAGRWTGAMSSMVLLRDCMWGECLSTRGCLEKVFTERLSGGTPKAVPAPKPEPVAPAPEPVIKNPEPADLPRTPSPETKHPASSGSDTPSDSEDDDEIDVVTVQKRRARRSRQPVMITVRADLLDPCMKHFHISIHQQQHNYAARLPPDPPSQQQPPASGAPLNMEQDDPPLSPTETLSSSLLSPPETPETPSPMSPKEGSSSGCGSSGSDGEVVKKKNHNYMERKRRYDLRSRFLALRDEVPGLATTSKTPKVVILGEATAFLHSLVVRERRLALEKRQLQARQRQLRKLILRLKAK